MKQLVLVLMLLVSGAALAQSSEDYCLDFMSDYHPGVYSRALDEVTYQDDSIINALGLVANGAEMYLAMPADNNPEHPDFVLLDLEGNTWVQPGFYRGMSLSEDGILLNSFEVDGQYYLWSKTATTDTFIVNAIYPNWGPDGQFSATGPDGALYIFSAEGEPEKIADNARHGVWSPNGQQFAYTTYQTGELTVIELASGDVVYQTPEHFWSVHLTWVTDEMLVVSGVFDDHTSRHLNLYEVYIAEEKVVLRHNQLGRDLYAPQAFECGENTQNAL